MASKNKTVKLKQGGKPGAGPLIFFAVFAVLICCFCNANAQRGNQSDWNVPPPLTPGTITKGDTEGRLGTSGKAALIFTDVTPAAQPTSLVSVPELPPISAVPAEVSTPEQPVAENVLADAPLPQVPEMPAMPGLSLQDVAEPLVTDIPMPAVPDMPPLPSEPVGSAGQNTTSSGLLPLMPAVSAPPVSFNGPPAEAVIWTTPAIPQIINLN
jgi:hypothetical protein